MTTYDADSLRCPSCGYDLRGLPHAKCPECGKEYDRDQLSAEQQRLLSDPTPPLSGHRISLELFVFIVVFYLSLILFGALGSPLTLLVPLIGVVGAIGLSSRWAGGYAMYWARTIETPPSRADINRIGRRAMILMLVLSIAATITPIGFLMLWFVY